MDRKVVEVSSLSLTFSHFLSLSLSLSLSFSLFLSLSLSFSLFLSLSLSFSLFLWLSTYLPTYLSTYLPIYLSIFLFFLSFFLSFFSFLVVSFLVVSFLFFLSFLSIYLSIHPSIYLSVYLSVYLSICLSICLSYPIISYSILSYPIHLSHLIISLSVCLSICLSASLKPKLFCETSWVFALENIKNAAILRDSARRPQFWNLTTSKTQQICETSSFSILRYFLIFRNWQHQKQNNSAILPHFSKLTTSKTKQFCETSFQNGKSECRADGLVPMCFAIFPVHQSKVLRLPRKSDARSCEVLHLSRKTISANLKIWCSQMQPLSGNQRPDLLR